MTEYIELALAIVGVASMIATMTPNKSDDKIVAWISKIVNLMAFNVGNARNK